MSYCTDNVAWRSDMKYLQACSRISRDPIQPSDGVRGVDEDYIRVVAHPDHTNVCARLAPGLSLHAAIAIIGALRTDHCVVLLPNGFDISCRRSGHTRSSSSVRIALHDNFTCILMCMAQPSLHQWQPHAGALSAGHEADAHCSDTACGCDRTCSV